MSFDMDRLRRFQPEEEMSQQDIKDLKDGVPNYPMVEIQGPEPLLENMCCECTGSGVMMGNYPCKPCGGTGYIVPEPENEYKPITMEAIQSAIDILDKIEAEKNKAFMDLVITGSTIVRKPPLEEIKNEWQKYYETYENGEQDVEKYKRLMGLDHPNGEYKNINWPKYSYTDLKKKLANAVYPNECELALLNSRIAKLKAQLSQELQKKKSQRNQFDIKNLQQSITNLTKWKLQSKNSTQTAY